MGIEWFDVALLAGTALVAAFVGSVTGGGVTVILLPVLVLHFGILVAMPIVTISLLAATASRVAVNRREIALPVALWFSAGSLPLTALGTYLFTVSPPGFLTRLLGVFLLGAVVVRRWHGARLNKFPAPAFLPLGAVFGFLTGISVGVASLLAPFFLGYGLRRGAYVGTAGLSILAIQLVKLGVFGSRDFLQPTVLTYGLLLVPFMVVGTVLGKMLLDRMSERFFVLVIEAVMIVAGLNFIVRGAG